MNSFLHVSERNHSGVILMAALAAEQDHEAFVSLRTVADEKGISQGYLEEIARALKQAGLIEGRQGPGGGYRLTRRPEAITIEDVLVALEGPLSMVECLAAPGQCPVEKACASKSVWSDIRRSIVGNLRQITLRDLSAKNL